MVRITAVHFISTPFHEGGDSEWLINYLKPIINGSCVQSMSIPLKKDKNLKEILKIKEMYSKPGIDAPGYFRDNSEREKCRGEQR